MSENEIVKLVIDRLPKYLSLAAVAALPLFAFQEAFAQRKMPELRVVEYKKIDRIDGISGTMDLEIVLSLSNVTSENVTVFGQNFDGKFSPLGTRYSVDPDERKIVYADETTAILKLNGTTYTASRTIAPSDTLRFSIFAYGGNPSCLMGLVAEAWVRIGRNKKVRRILSEPLKPCNRIGRTKLKTGRGRG